MSRDGHLQKALAVLISGRLSVNSLTVKRNFSGVTPSMKYRRVDDRFDSMFYYYSDTALGADLIILISY